MPEWMAYGPDAGGVRTCRMQGTILRAQGVVADADAARADAQVRGVPVARISGTAPQAVPALVLPETGRDVPALTQAAPPDVLGGWARLRIAGVLAVQPGWDGVVVDTGPETSHWVHLSAGEIVSFQGFATGRLMTALGGAAEADAQAADATLSRPERLAAHLHATHLAGDARALAGHLVGAEIAATKPYWLGQQVVVIADADSLATVLRAQGVEARTAPPDDMLARGLGAFGERAGLTG